MSIYNIQLLGTPTCRRYQRMRKRALQAVKQLECVYQLEEINDTQRLSQYNPLSLPRLVINEQVIATQNPPKTEDILDKLRFLEESI